MQAQLRYSYSDIFVEVRVSTSSLICTKFSGNGWEGTLVIKLEKPSPILSVTWGHGLKWESNLLTCRGSILLNKAIFLEQLKVHRKNWGGHFLKHCFRAPALTGRGGVVGLTRECLAHVTSLTVTGVIHPFPGLFWLPSHNDNTVGLYIGGRGRAVDNYLSQFINKPKTSLLPNLHILRLSSFIYMQCVQFILTFRALSQLPMWIPHNEPLLFNRKPNRLGYILETDLRNFDVRSSTNSLVHS